MVVLVVHIPQTHVEQVKEALFAAGAGRLSNYEKCSFEVVGSGQFAPLMGAKPFIGKVGEVEKVVEVRLETTLAKKDVQNVVKALKETHPYEVPSYHLIEVTTLEH